MLVDANILLYAVDDESPFQLAAKAWMEQALNGTRRIAIPWSSLTAFVRISTHPRAMNNPLSPTEAWEFVEEWLDNPLVWIPQPGKSHRAILGRLIRDLDLRANLISDAAIAAVCIEHGLSVVSADTDFARFAELNWINPIAA